MTTPGQDAQACPTCGDQKLRGVGAGAQNARKTHCEKGHLLEGDNLVPWAKYRMCRECTRANDRSKARNRRAKARAAA